MIIEEIALGKEESEKRQRIQENLGREAFVSDNHNGWCHGTILEEGCDDEVYRMNLNDAREERQLHYHDLKQLLIIRNYSPRR